MLKVTTARVTGDCNNADFQIFVAGIHCISEWNFNAWTRNYDPTTPSGKNFSASYISNLISQVDCDSAHIEVGTSDDNTGIPGTNSDIEFNVIFDVSKTYSIALFKGILHLFQPDEFYFYKAYKSQNNFDVIFRAEKNGETVYFGDVSDTQP